MYQQSNRPAAPPGDRLRYRSGRSGQITAAMHAVHSPPPLPGGTSTASEPLSANQVLAA